MTSAAACAQNVCRLNGHVTMQAVECATVALLGQKAEGTTENSTAISS